jgi:hypothetical protein
MIIDITNSERVYTEGRGDILLDCLDGNRVVTIRFKNVWFVLDLDYNLLSVASLKEQ